LVYPEVAHTLLRLHRNGVVPLERAQVALRAMLALALERRPVEQLVGHAWPLALARRISVYDACYAILAETLDVPLVTADRKLAAATAHAILLS
jgi:predicted nucleic acid-binding protein